MGVTSLFKNDFWDGNRPKDFAFLLRPTAKELTNFTHLLDKMLSENVNKNFFYGLVSSKTERVQADGKIIEENKGSLQMLEEFIRKSFKPKEEQPLNDMFATFKKIRSLRTDPAHKVLEDIFDLKYFKEQRELFIKSYGAVRCLRLILQNHPRADRNKVPDWLYKGEIWTY